MSKASSAWVQRLAQDVMDDAWKVTCPAPLLYSVGFMMATGTLHALGIGIGVIHRFARGRVALRALGALVAAAGAYFLWRALA